MKNSAIIKASLQNNKLLYSVVALLVALLIHVAVIYQQPEVQSNTANAKLFAAVVDNDKSEQSRLVIERFLENPSTNVKEYNDYEMALRALLRQEVEAIFVIKDDFGRKLKSGNIKNSVELQYTPGSVTAEIIGENFGREILRIVVSEKGIANIKRQYRRVEEEFTDELEAEAAAHTEAFWEEGLTLAMDISYADIVVKNEHSQASSIQELIVEGLAKIGVLILLFQFANELVSQRKSGLIKRIKLQGVGNLQYSFLWVGIKILFIAAVFSSISMVLGVLGIEELLYYLKVIVVGAVGAIVFGELRDGKLLFSLIPLAAIVMALLL